MLNRMQVLAESVTIITENEHDLTQPPLPPGGGSVEVEVGMYILALGDIDEMAMDFVISLHLRHSWNDYRLSTDDATTRSGSVVIPDQYFSGLVWIPDTYFSNSKDEKFHEYTQKNWSFRLYNNGDIEFSQRLTMTVSCFLYLYQFPLETAICHLDISAYKLITQEMTLRWNNNRPVQHETIQLSRYQLMNEGNISIGDCTKIYATGNFSCLFIELEYQRMFGYYMMHDYMPTALVVILSWVSFHLEPVSTLARTTLCVMSIMTMTTAMSHSASATSLPKVSYVTGIDIWMTFCMLLLFLALVEFAVVNSLARTENMFSGRGTRVVNSVYDNKRLKVSGFRRFLTREYLLSAKGIDHASKWLFPGMFGLFNIIYWSVFTNDDNFRQMQSRLTAST